MRLPCFSMLNIKLLFSLVKHRVVFRFLVAPYLRTTTSNKENYLGELGFKVKTLKFGQPVHSAHPTNSIGVQFL